MVTQPESSLDDLIELSLHKIRLQKANLYLIQEEKYRVLEAMILDQMQINHELLRISRTLDLSKEATPSFDNLFGL